MLCKSRTTSDRLNYSACWPCLQLLSAEVRWAGCRAGGSGCQVLSLLYALHTKASNQSIMLVGMHTSLSAEDVRCMQQLGCMQATE